MDSIFASIYPKLTPEDQEVLRQEMRESFGYERELGAITGIELCKFILSERDEKRAVAALRTDATFQKALGRMEQRIAEAVAAEREACAAICREAGETALSNHQECSGQVAGALFVTAAAIRARAGGEEATLPESPRG